MRGNGVVPGRMPSIHDHAHWEMVEPRLPQMYTEISNGVQPKRGQKNASLPELQAHP
jgi:hypothetical protein